MSEQNKDLQGKFDALAKQNEDLLHQVAGQKKVIADHEKAAAKHKGKEIEKAAGKSKPAIPSKAIKSKDGRTHKFRLAKFFLPNKGLVQAEDAIHDPELIEEILAIEGQGILQEQH